MSEEQRHQREGYIKFIKKTWSLDDVYDIFPTPIKPLSLGNSGMTYLKSLAARVPNKNEAQNLMMRECTTTSGKHVHCGHTVLVRIVRSLMVPGPSPSASTFVKSKGSPEKSTPAVVQPKRVSKAGAEVSQRLNPDYSLF
jgi:hypothetical protein